MKDSIVDTLVVTATLGDRMSLRQTIDSVKRIGGERVNHILVTPSERYPLLRSKYPDLEILVEPESCAGIFDALNFAFFCYGKNYSYLTFINDDDYWLSSYEDLFHILDRNEKIDIVYANVKFVNTKSQVIKIQPSSRRFKSFKYLLQSNIILFTQQSCIMKSHVFFDNGGFDVSYKLIADTKFWINAIENGSYCQYYNNVCAAYTIQSSQLSSNTSLQDEEHDRLKEEIGIKFSFKSFWEMIVFRLLNVDVYVKRLISVNQ